MRQERKKKRIRRSFNRYMVECELSRKAGFINHFRVLIDTWWNVNIVMV